ncbi:unnamed protein product [Brachionus calyciflorus]|uniref:Uncharacterized protein n=1 Tax=Brachionus calyciflorus TaxID=104777 RepID=A0A814N1I9_9BILA|nr:unnamed protein product [Brachionus calyciflorus]
MNLFCDYCNEPKPLGSLLISLECGFRICLSHLNQLTVDSTCLVCERHTISIGNCLRIPRNKGIIAQCRYQKICKHIQNDLGFLNQIRNDPDFFLDECSSRLINLLDIRRENILQSLDNQIKDYSDALMQRVYTLFSRKKNDLIRLLDNLDDVPVDDLNIDECRSVDKQTFYGEKLNKLQNTRHKLKVLSCEIDKIKDHEFSKLYEFDLNIEKFFGRLSSNFSSKIKPKIPDFANLNLVYSALIDDEITCLVEWLPDHIYYYVNNLNIIFAFNLKNHTEKINQSAVFNYLSYIKPLSYNLMVTFSYDYIIIWNNRSNQAERFIITSLFLRNIRRYANANKNVVSIDILNECILCLHETGHLSYWLIENGKLLKYSLIGEEKFVCIKLFDDERLLIASRNGKVIIWNLEKDVILKTLHGHDGIVTTIEKLNEREFISCDENGNIRIWEIYGGCVKSFRISEEQEEIYQILILDSDKFLTSSNGRVILWDRYQNDPNYVFNCLLNARHILVTHYGQFILAADNCLQIWS